MSATMYQVCTIAGIWWIFKMLILLFHRFQEGGFMSTAVYQVCVLKLNYEGCS